MTKRLPKKDVVIIGLGWTGSDHGAGAPNITPVLATGIGAWSGEQFDRAVRVGIGAQGEHLYPAMQLRKNVARSRRFYVQLSKHDPCSNEPCRRQPASISSQHPRIDERLGRVVF
jgi:hypothetical protein